MLGDNTKKYFLVNLKSHQRFKLSYDSQVPPVQQVAKSFRSVTLDDTLTTVQLSEVKHVLRKLLNGVLEPDEATIDDVNSVGLWISDVLLHEATEARQVCRDTWNAHHGAFSWCVAPWLVVRWENT